MTLAAADFAFVCDLTRRSAAIVLDPGKEYLVETRLTPLAEREGFTSLPELISAAKAGQSERRLQDKIVDALTTNETSFFRDSVPFEALRKNVLPELIAKRVGQRKLTIWSAACSTGQEPYSIAMLIREYFPELLSWGLQIFATDLSPTVLTKAQAGVYTQVEIGRGLSPEFKAKYFSPTGSNWTVCEAVRRMVTFQSTNLISNWPLVATPDIVLLRNVMIYFDVNTRKAILSRMRATVASDGYLLLGTAETTMNLDPLWSPLSIGGATLYQALS